MEKDKVELSVEFELLPEDMYYETPLTIRNLSTNNQSKNDLKGQGFGSIEHQATVEAFIAFREEIEAMGVQVFNTLEDSGLFNIKESKLKLSDKVTLGAGEIISLAGDFYGLPDKPISGGIYKEDRNLNKAEEQQRFLDAFNQLANDEKNDMAGILQQISTEEKAILESLKKGLKPNEGLKKVSNWNNYKYGILTKYTRFPFMFFHSRYIKLSENNFDHFGPQAKKAYLVGHEIAINTANKAYDADANDKQQEAHELLIKAFAQELFACHFLTDLFSSGHMRTPRRELYDYIMNTLYLPGKSKIAGLLAKEMHDEDNINGLWVKDKLNPPNVWEAYGDDCYFNVENVDNKNRIIATVKEALMNVYNAFCGKKVDPEEILNYIPEPLKMGEKANNKNGQEVENKHWPMFRVENNVLQERVELHNSLSELYQPLGTRTPVEILMLLKLRPKRGEKETSISENDRKALEEEVNGLFEGKDSKIENNCAII